MSEAKFYQRRAKSVTCNCIQIKHGEDELGRQSSIYLNKVETLNTEFIVPQKSSISDIPTPQESIVSISPTESNSTLPIQGTIEQEVRKGLDLVPPHQPSSITQVADVNPKPNMEDTVAGVRSLNIPTIRTCTISLVDANSTCPMKGMRDQHEEQKDLGFLAPQESCVSQEVAGVKCLNIKQNNEDLKNTGRRQSSWIPETPGKCSIDLNNVLEPLTSEGESTETSVFFPICLNRSIDGDATLTMQEQLTIDDGAEFRCFATHKSSISDISSPRESTIFVTSTDSDSTWPVLGMGDQQEVTKELDFVTPQESSCASQGVYPPPNVADVVTRVESLNIQHNSEDLKKKGGRQKPKRKKHRPKVVVEGVKAKKKTLQPETPKLKTPKLAKPKKLRQQKPKRERANFNEGVSSRKTDVGETSSQKKECGRKTCRRALSFAKDESAMITTIPCLDNSEHEGRYFPKISTNMRSKRKRRLNTLFMFEPILKVPTRKRQRKSARRVKVAGENDSGRSEQLTTENGETVIHELEAGAMEHSLVDLNFHKNVAKAIPLAWDEDVFHTRYSRATSQWHNNIAQATPLAWDENVFSTGYSRDMQEVLQEEHIEPTVDNCSVQLFDFWQLEKFRVSEDLLKEFDHYVHQKLTDPLETNDLYLSSKSKGILTSTSTLTHNSKEVSEEESHKNALVPFAHIMHGSLVTYQERPRRKRKVPKKGGKVDLDSDTLKIWYFLTNEEDKTREEKLDKESEDWWKRERELFKARVDSFLFRMHCIQGDRKFTPWKASVTDSVVGVFITQNVSDTLSSSAYMTLAARFPLQLKSDDPEITGLGYFITEPEPSTSCNLKNRKDPSSFGIEQKYFGPNEDMMVVEETSGSSILSCEEQLKDKCATSGRMDSINEAVALERRNDLKGDSGSNSLSDLHNPLEHFASSSTVEASGRDRSGMAQVEDVTGKKKKNAKEEKEEVDWDAMRRMYSNDELRHKDRMDSVDWEAVRHADQNEIADAIKGRGQHNNIAGNIKEFLNRVFKLHNSLDLEWLRNAPPEKVKEYLLEIRGLGLKSVECIRLLSLHHKAFPVDTNVCRIAVRLGWVPLQTLPGDLHIHDLEQYPLMDSVQKYLWPRLCHLDQPELYELHYQMITFGKVFCTKLNPNCGPCPLKGECKHFASAFASERLKLPGPSEKRVVNSKFPNVVEENPTVVVNQIPVALLEGHPFSGSGYPDNKSEPIIEVPQSPEPQCSESPAYIESDIEDLCNYGDGIPTINLQEKEFKENLQNFMEMNNIEVDSRTLIALTEEAKRIPAPKLKKVSRLRTEHLAYVLPDNHEALRGFERREPDDICPYLLVIWSPGETPNSTQPPQKRCNSKEHELCDDNRCSSCNIIREQRANIVRGTILIPCRTANRGRFPLNGTYFQVNEVFADHETSEKPIEVPRNTIATLPRVTVCFGTGTSSIFRALDIEAIQQCFWRGYICVRGYERSCRTPRPLQRRLHCQPTMMEKNNRKPRDD